MKHYTIKGKIYIIHTLGGEEMKRGRNGEGEKFLPRRHGKHREE